MEFGPDGKVPADDGGLVLAEDEVAHDGADAVVDAEAGFVPGVEGEEDGVCGEEPDALCQLGSDKGGFEVVDVSGVVVKELCFGLV